jgi:hypothetical protein
MVLSRNRTQTRFVVLPPAGQIVSDTFRNVERNPRRYDALLAQMQRFRGHVYLNDGAIQPSDLHEGRHTVTIDENSWHVLSLDSSDRICACLRYLEERHARSVEDLWVNHAAVASCPKMGRHFRSAVETEMARARRMRIGFGEVGGWAVAESYRATLEPLRIILATYALLQLRGGCAGVATATFRHSSSSILRRIGLNSLCYDGAELAPYYDPAYQCQMEVLQFDSRFPNEKYRASVNELSVALAASPVICRDSAKLTRPAVLPGLEMPLPAGSFTPNYAWLPA